jgi:Zn-dependent protease with chaperone function
MTSNDIAKLSFKLLAVYFVMQLFTQSENIGRYLLYSNQWQEYVKANYLAAIFPSILFFIFGLILWFVAPHLANSVFKPEPAKKSRVPLENFHSVAFSIAGLFLFATSLSAIVEYIVYDIKMANTTGSHPFSHVIITAIIKIVLGVWLILGSKGIVNGIRSLRRA